ncbi:CPBP family glutamic-type intramembrane protease [Pseudonocardia sp. NPDC046786]|uniref:CPBP family glutamic-type intramembrane protease n=1 Tax=Pseudonocardia sp. NPDC046786 TaxID=3155471 RepID=UPI0033C0C638
MSSTPGPPGPSGHTSDPGDGSSGQEGWAGPAGAQPGPPDDGTAAHDAAGPGDRQHDPAGHPTVQPGPAAHPTMQPDPAAYGGAPRQHGPAGHGAPYGYGTARPAPPPQYAAAGHAPPWPGPGAPHHGPAGHGPPPEPPTGPFGLSPSPTPRVRWGLWAFLVVEIVFLGASAVMAWTTGVDSAGGVLLAIAVPTMLAALTCILWTLWRGDGPAADLGLRFRWEDVGVGLLIGIAGLFVTVPAALLYLYLVGPELSTSVGVAFEGITAGWPIALAVMFGVVVIAPVCEEIVYRGLLWNAVAKWISNRWVVFVITTLVFAIAHLEFLRAPLLFVVALPLGIARILTGRITASVVAHAVNNFLPGLALALMLVGALPQV